MRFQSVWVHGSSVRIENPENLVSYKTYGWGTDVIFRKTPYSKHDSWFHASVPSSLGELEDTYLLSVEILFLAIHCKLDTVDIYDGSSRIESPAWRHVHGEYRFKKGIDTYNKYMLSRPHRVFCGIGVSFHVYVDSDSGPFRDDVKLIVASVGANFRVDSLVRTERRGMNISVDLGP